MSCEFPYGPRDWDEVETILDIPTGDNRRTLDWEFFITEWVNGMLWFTPGHFLEWEELVDWYQKQGPWTYTYLDEMWYIIQNAVTAGVISMVEATTLLGMKERR